MVNGKLLLFLAITAFVVQSEIVQAIQGTGKYYKPWFILYIGHSFYALFIPLIYIHQRFIKKKAHGDAFSFVPRISKDLPKFGFPPSEVNLFHRLCSLTILFTSASLPWYVSVSRIPLAEVSAIFNTSCFFTYLLAMIFLKEKFLWVKLFAVIISVLGIVSISLGNDLRITAVDPTKVVGYTSAVLSSIGVAGYEVLYSRTVVPLKPSSKFALFITGSMGMITMIGGLLVFPIMHITGLEVFELPDWTSFVYILLNACLGVIYNVLFILVMTFTNPVFAAVGILMSVPLTSLVDMIVLGTPFGMNMAIGTMLIFLGFVLLQLNTLFPGDIEISSEEEEPLLPSE